MSEVDLGFQWGWRIFQAGIFMAVFSANIYWDIEKNPYAVGVVALFLTICATWAVATMIDLVRYGLRRPGSG